MGQGEVFIYCGIAFVFGIILFIAGFIFLREKRLIENIPTSKIRSIAMGLVEIYGEIVPFGKKILKSPFSNSDCVYYKYQVEEYRSSGKSSHWVTVSKGQKGVPFYLKDSTGKVLVDPNGARVDIPKDNEFKSGFRNDPPAIVKKFLESNYLKYTTILKTNKTMRYREYFIAPKDKLYIMGTAGDNPYVKEATAINSVDDIMIQKGEHEKFYYISDKPESEVLKILKWKVIGFIFGGAAMSVVSLIVIFKYMLHLI